MAQTQELVASRYRILEAIGVGGMGTVFKAVDSQSGDEVAIKRLKSDNLDAANELIERFTREGEVLRRLNHPNIVRVRETAQENGHYYLVMDYMGGGDLSDYIKEGHLSPTRIAEIALDLADALTRAHRLNIIHRDIKPSNVLIALDGTPRLTDFGVAYLSKMERVTETGAMVGTLDYLAPELLNGDEIDPRVDIWAFGVLLFEMLTGQRPFHAGNVGATMHNILTAPTPDLESMVENAPTALLDLIYRMLTKDRNERIPSVRLVGAELEALLKGTGSSSFRRTEPSAFQEVHTLIIEGGGRFNTPSTPTAAPKHNLPGNLTPFVGREEELAELARLIEDPGIRLITILAHGGMGKSRLGLELAARNLDNFADGVFFVSLAPLKSADNMVSTIAEAVGFKFESAADEHQQLMDYLRGKSLLLVMDNFEHLLDGAQIVSDILQNAPSVQVVATSREQLNLHGESRFRISGMEFPEWETPEDALEYSAVKLFLQSARRAQPGFELTADDLTYVARICRLVLGMPLGIVLAAAWVDNLTLNEIAEEILASLDFLESDAPNMPERHKSIRAVFETSWVMLTEEEKNAFLQLSVFRGGFSRRAAQHITGASLRTLTGLVNKSLLSRNADDGRYHVHELLRQYAEAELERLGTAQPVRMAHSQYYLNALAERTELLKGQDQLAVLNDIEGDIENVRQGWLWAFEHKEFESILAANHAFWLFHANRNRFRELAVLLNVLDTVQLDSLPHAGKIVWHWLTMFRLAVDNSLKPYQKRDQFNHHLASVRQLKAHRQIIGWTLFQLSVNHAFMGDYSASMDALNEGLALAEAANDQWGIAWISINKAWLYSNYLGDYTSASPLEEKAITIFEGIGERFGTARAYVGRALTLWRLGDKEGCINANTKAIKMYREIGTVGGVAGILNNLAWLFFWDGDLVKSRTMLEEALEITTNLGFGTEPAVNNLGYVAHAEGKLGEAAENFLSLIRKAYPAMSQSSLMYEAMAGAALVLADGGHAEFATTVTQVALLHPASTTSPEVQGRMTQLLEELQAKLPAKTFATAVEQGKKTTAGAIHLPLIEALERLLKDKAYTS